MALNGPNPYHPHSSDMDFAFIVTLENEAKQKSWVLSRV